MGEADLPLERFDLPPPPPPLRPFPALEPPPPPLAVERPGDCVGDEPADLDDDPPPPPVEIALEAEVAEAVRAIAGAVAPVVEVLTTLAAAADAAAAANESGFAGKCAGAGGRSEDALGVVVVV